MSLLEYKASKTFTKVHNDDRFIRVVVGPVGSGKSVGCCWEIFLRAMKQKPNADGIRMSRWIIVRNTLPQLETTTMATWKQWFGDHIFKGARISGRPPYRQTIDYPLGDGTSVNLEVIFLALDAQEDVTKLLSLEATGIWFNEFRDIDEEIFKVATSRVGRYPRELDGGCTWHGIICDTNPPDIGHWVYKLCEENESANVSVYKQPSGLSPDAENLKYLPKGYYENMAIGKPKEWINVYVHGKYGYFQDGKSVYEGVWNDDYHFANEKLQALPGRPLVGGIDASGRSPAAVIMQTTPTGQLQCLWEMCVFDVGAVQFSKLLRQEIQMSFPHHNIRWWGDPAGGFKTQTDERTYFDILRGEGIQVYPSPGMRFNERLEGVNSILSRNIGGKPAFLLSKECNMLRKGFNGGYKYRNIGFGGNKRTLPEPEKNEYSHCFVAGTMVETIDGKTPIESINIGDLVYTPLGYKRVLNTMNKVSNVVEVKVGEEKIICTPDHKFATSLGYSRADTLQYGNIIRKESLWAGKLFIKLKNLQEKNITTSQTDIIRQTINRGGNICTEPFGNTITEIFLKVRKYTTLIKTKQITELKTLSYFPQTHTQNSTLWSVLEPTVLPLRKQLNQHKKRLKYGTEVMLADNGTENTLDGFLKAYPSLNMNVLSAEQSTQRKRGRGKLAIVRQLASLKQGVNRVLMTLKECALIVALNLVSIATPRQKRVVASVLPSSELKTVYDLTIEDAHCFYVEGVLVSNCHDALQYGISGTGELNTMKARQRADYKVYDGGTDW